VTTVAEGDETTTATTTMVARSSSPSLSKGEKRS
jgi:hypothetical protein